MKGVDPKMAIEQLFAAAGFSTEGIHFDSIGRSMDRRITADFDHQPFLVALLEICRQSMLYPSLSDEAETGIEFFSLISRPPPASQSMREDLRLDEQAIARIAGAEPSETWVAGEAHVDHSDGS